MNKSGLFVGAVFVAGIAAFGYQFFTPSEPMGHSMTPPDLTGIDEGSPIAKVAIPAAFSDNAVIGKRVFEAKCAECHGANAAGQNGVAPPLVHKIYEPSHHSDMAFIVAARNGVRAHHWSFGNMPRIEGITDGEVKFVIAYIRELQRENGIN